MGNLFHHSAKSLDKGRHIFVRIGICYAKDIRVSIGDEFLQFLAFHIFRKGFGESQINAQMYGIDRRPKGMGKRQNFSAGKLGDCDDALGTSDSYPYKNIRSDPCYPGQILRISPILHIGYGNYLRAR